jgi:hypothetical protein
MRREYVHNSNNECIRMRALTDVCACVCVCVYACVRVHVCTCELAGACIGREYMHNTYIYA